jgi:acyl-homoserine lactone acylase PvdQ
MNTSLTAGFARSNKRRNFEGQAGGWVVYGEKLEIRRTVQGPVVFDEKGFVVAMRVAGLDRPKMLE